MSNHRARIGRMERRTRKGDTKIFVSVVDDAGNVLYGESAPATHAGRTIKVKPARYPMND